MKITKPKPYYNESKFRIRLPSGMIVKLKSDCSYYKSISDNIETVAGLPMSRYVYDNMYMSEVFFISDYIKSLT